MRARLRVLLALVGLAVSACHDLFQVDSPVRVPATDLNNPALAPVLVQSAIGDFECAFGDYASDVALVTDEFYGSALQPVNTVDVRLLNSLSGQAGTCATIRSTPVAMTYVPLQTARFQAEDTYARLQAWADAGETVPAPGATVLMAVAAAYAGYVYTLFGEGFCRSAFDLGPALTWDQVLAIAEQRFTTAITLAESAGVDSVRNFALVGRARVRLTLGRLADAQSDAVLVPPGFVKYATFSSDSPRRQNQLYVWNYGALWATVDPRFRTLKVGAVPDPRVPAFDGGQNGADGRTRLWFSGKTVTDASPIPIATWEEAQLIIAEAAGGQTAVNRINALRTKYGLPLFASSDPDSITNQVREERRRQLFLQGHRLNDMLRFGLPFDTGVNNKGQAYGTMTCFPLPTVETNNNPNAPAPQPNTR